MPARLSPVPGGHLVPLQVRHAALDPLGRVLEARDVLRRVLLAPDLGAGDALERVLDLRELVIGDRLVLVEREAGQPAPDLELARHRVDDRVRDRALLLPPLVACREDRPEQHRVHHLRHHPNRPVEHQAPHRVDDEGQVVLVPDPQPERHVDLGERHQPDAHLRDDPEARLHEELVGRRSETALVHVPGLVVRHRAHAGAHDLAVREHDLHPALGRHVHALRQIGHAVVQRVPDDAAPTEIRDRDHQPVAARLDRLVEIEPAHARLDHRVAALLVDLEHAVHPPEAHDHRALDPRRGPAVAVVAAGAVRSTAAPCGGWRSARSPGPARRVSGITTADAVYSSQLANANGSRNSRNSSSDVSTAPARARSRSSSERGRNAPLCSWTAQLPTRPRASVK